MTKIYETIKLTIQNLRKRWKPLFVTDFLYKLLSLMILGPIVSALYRMLLASSGNYFLSDQDIALFALTPIGLTTTLFVGALQMATFFLGLASLFAILADRSETRMRPTAAIRQALGNAPKVTLLAAQMIGRLALNSLPFLLVIGVIYLTLLNDHDINYYLHERTPKFLWAVAMAGAVLVCLMVVLVRKVLSWLFSLPILLFENHAPSHSLRLSRERTDGRRLKLFLYLLIWLVPLAIMSACATALTVGVIRFFLPEETTSLFQLVTIIGVALCGWILANSLISLFGSASLAALIFNLYRINQAGGIEKVNAENKSDVHQVDSKKQLSRTKFIGLTFAGFMFSLILGAVLLQSIKVKDKAIIIAHRGSSLAAPENTMAAIKLAIEEGADWVEIDVQETADGAVVVIHDSDFMKLAGNPIKIWDAKASDLEKIDIGSWFDAEFGNERVPTLSQVLKTCKGKVGVFIELKSYGRGVRLEERVAEIVEEHDMVDEIVIMSLKADAVAKMKSLRPDWTVGFLMSVSAGDLSKTDADFLAVNASFASRNFIKSAQGLGKPVYVWTVNDALEMSVSMSRGVDGIITDKPLLARRVLKQRANMTVPNRLLLELAKILGVTPKIDEQ